jgi:hypothetical protein
LLTIHLVGLAMGLGAAIIADVSFGKALRMGDRITPETVGWLRTFSQVVWAGLGLLTVSGLGLFWLQPSQFIAMPGFQAKMFFVAVLAVNGLFLNYYTTARLTTFNFSDKYNRQGAAWKVRKLSFIFGAVSTVSWYGALGAAVFKTYLTISLWEYILLYLLALAAAIGGALTLEYLLMKRSLAARPQTMFVSDLAASPSPQVAAARAANQVAPVSALSPSPLPAAMPQAPAGPVVSAPVGAVPPVVITPEAINSAPAPSLDIPATQPVSNVTVTPSMTSVSPSSSAPLGAGNNYGGAEIVFSRPGR